MIESKIDTAELERRLVRIAGNVKSRTTVNRQIATQLTAWVLRNFRGQGGLSVSGWAPLKPATIKAKARKGYSMILQNTGALRQSFMPFSDTDMAGTGAQQLKGSSAPLDLAKIHQEGAPAANIPARPMLPTMDQALPIGIKIYELHIAKAVGGSR